MNFHSQSPCWSFRASGIIVQIIVSMAVIVHQLRGMAFTYCMETEGFTTTTNSLPSELFMRPYKRWACLGVSVLVHYCIFWNSVCIIGLFISSTHCSAKTWIGHSGIYALFRLERSVSSKIHNSLHERGKNPLKCATLP